MRKRAPQTVSERELVCALAKTGRPIGLSDLGAWRRSSLLPPFASCGTGAGRSYYWREPDIQERAEAVFDALALCARIDSALICIWLTGFDVPLERLRRALLHRVRIRAAGHTAAGAAEGSASGPMSALIEMVHPRQRHPVFGASWEHIRSRSELKRHLDRLSLLYRPLTENIALIQRAPDADLLKTRHYLLGLSNDRGKPKAVQSSETLFLFLLALVRAGQGEVLQKIDAFSATRRAPPSRSAESVRVAS